MPVVLFPCEIQVRSRTGGTRSLPQIVCGSLFFVSPTKSVHTIPGCRSPLQQLANINANANARCQSSAFPIEMDGNINKRDHGPGAPDLPFNTRTCALVHRNRNRNRGQVAQLDHGRDDVPDPHIT